MELKLSIIYSLYNRTKLFERGLETVLRQTMNPAEFEVIVIDDGSTENVLELLGKYQGKLNIHYIRYDHRRHPIWKELNPQLYFPDDFLPADQWPILDTNSENWYHTQAISANIGINAALGEIICISQPEILHSPNSFLTGYEGAKQNRQIFSEIHWGTDRFNQWLSENDWQAYPYDSLLEIAENFGAEFRPAHQPPHFYEMYWYTLFLPKSAAIGVNGVDLAYQKGVYAEDDQFKTRVRMAGFPDTWGGRPNMTGSTANYCVGIHQSHQDEGKKYKKQNREGKFWEEGADRNRKLWSDFFTHPYTIANEDISYDPWGSFLITDELIMKYGENDDK